ncbi:hypothetical protein SLEP1_g54014 [Rubroshorea leprosula]|uniref:Uncharacterized protein n=1 Tax=Rubroshorea leprosula TaxID=152421 RepID=A0AAV5MF28_9ROSI|nr:hypothetical protein SLEP1_g54014 [Rubroshorea leprosula]
MLLSFSARVLIHLFLNLDEGDMHLHQGVCSLQIWASFLSLKMHVACLHNNKEKA